MGGNHCCIIGCTANRSRNRGLSFFRLPHAKKHPEWRTKLLQVIDPIKKDTISLEKLTVCSRHFSRECLIENTNQRKRNALHVGSIPTLVLPEKSISTTQTTPRKPPISRKRMAPSNRSNIPDSNDFDAEIDSDDDPLTKRHCAESFHCDHNYQLSESPKKLIKKLNSSRKTIIDLRKKLSHTIPLAKRLAADGRGLQGVHVNENCVTLAEAWSLADRIAREAVEMRAQIEKKMAQKEKEKRADGLRLLASKVREERAGIRHKDDDKDDDMGEREEIRRERQKNRQRDRNLARAAPEKRNRLQKERERDITPS